MTEQTETTTSQDASLDAIAFAGATLAPFFLNDPRTGDAADAFAALAELDVEAAAAEWPFVDAVEAAADLALMREALSPEPITRSWCGSTVACSWGRGICPRRRGGSVYTDHECVIFGEATLALRAWMRACGIERTTDERTPEGTHRAHAGPVVVPGR